VFGQALRLLLGIGLLKGRGGLGLTAPLGMVASVYISLYAFQAIFLPPPLGVEVPGLACWRASADFYIDAWLQSEHPQQPQQQRISVEVPGLACWRALADLYIDAWLPSEQPQPLLRISGANLRKIVEKVAEDHVTLAARRCTICKSKDQQCQKCVETSLRLLSMDAKEAATWLTSHDLQGAAHLPPTVNRVWPLF